MTFAPAKLSKEYIKQLYVEQNKTDSEIAYICGVGRTYISHLRKKFSIKTRLNNGHKGELVAIQKLKELGFQVEDMNKITKTYIYDLRINGKCRVEIKSTKKENNRFLFTLRTNRYRGCIESENKIKLPNGSYRKIFKNTCDFFLLTGLDGEGTQFFIVPSGFISNTQQNVSLSAVDNPKNKYNSFRNNWVALGR